MTEMTRESNVKENIDERQINDFWRERVENAMDDYCVSVQFRKVKLKKDLNKKINMFQQLEEKILKLQAKIEFRTTKKRAEQMSCILDKIVNVNVQPSNSIQNKSDFHAQTIAYLENVMFDLDNFDFEKIEQTLTQLEILKNQTNTILRDNSNMKTSIEYSIKDLEHLLKQQKEKLTNQKRLTKTK